jgi:hypothetical protein
MTDTKPIWQSVTFWGVVIAAGAALFQAFGLGAISEPEQQQLAQGLTHAGELVGLLLALVGRVKATRQVTITPQAQEPK